MSLYAAVRRRIARLITGKPPEPAVPPLRADGTPHDCPWQGQPHEGHWFWRVTGPPSHPMPKGPRNIRVDCPGIPEPARPARDLYAALVDRRTAFLYADPFLTRVEPVGIRLHPNTWAAVWRDEDGSRSLIGSFVAEGGHCWTFSTVPVCLDRRTPEGTAEVRWTDGRVTSEDFAGERVS